MNLLMSHGLLVSSAVLQMTVVLAGCWILARWMRNHSATLAHGVSVAGLLGILIIPVGLLVKTPWEVTVPTIAREVKLDTAAVAMEAISPAELLPSAIATKPILMPMASQGDMISATGAAEQPRDATSESAGLIFAITTWSMSNWIIVIWFFVVVILLGRLLTAVLRLRSITRCSILAADTIASEADDLRQQLGIRHVDVRVSHDETRMPVAFWWCGWTVCLPKAANHWDADLLRSVLAHELGHVVRRDAATDLLGQVACVVYWFHPLVWLSVSSSRWLREQACDDLVLASVSMEPKHYANHLLDVVSRCVQPRNQLASAIARSSSIETRIRRILTTKAKSIPTASRSRVVMALVLLAAVGVWTLRLKLQAAESGGAEATRDTTAEVAADDLVSVRGKVVDEHGKPYPNAEVVLRVIPASFRANLGMQRKPDFMARTQTAQDGSFSFSAAAIPAPYRGHRTGDAPLLEVLVTTPNHGLTYKSFNKSVDELEVTLRPKGDFSGIVVDSDGNPIANTIIEVYSIGDASAPFDVFAESAAYSNLQWSSFAPTATTDANGQFRFENIPDGSLIGFYTRHADYVKNHGLADNSKGTNPYTVKSIIGDVEVLASPLRIELDPGRQIELTLIDSDGNPVDTTPNIAFPGLSQMTKVKPGKYVVTHGDSGKCYVEADIPSARILLRQTVELTDEHLKTPCKLEIQVPKTRLVVGRVLNDIGQGVADVEVSWSDGQHWYSSTKTDIAGNYEIHVVPGQGELQYAGSTDWNARGVLLPVHRAVSSETKPPTLSIDVPESDVANIPDMLASRGLILSGVVKDSSDDLAIGAKVEVYTGDMLMPMSGNATTDDLGRYSISGLNPSCDYHILVTHNGEVARDKTNKQNGIVLAKASEGGVEYFDTVQIVKNIVTRETVAITGRVLLNGKPVAEMPIELDVGTEIQMQVRKLGEAPRNRRGTRYTMVAATKTNAQGEYEILGALQGEKFEMRLKPPFPAIAQGGNYQRVPDIVPSKKYSLGDTNLVRLGQTLSGRVVDPDGNPVKGATVRAKMADGRTLSRIDSRVLDVEVPPPWTKTDANGRFRLTYLPDQPIKLMAYFAYPQGGQIHLPPQSKPDQDQQDIEIILDPALHQE